MHWGTAPPKNPVIPTEVTRLFLAHVLCAPGRAVEGPWQPRSLTSVDGTQPINHDRHCFSLTAALATLRM
jgi:hypothetical protein